jgi:hypothetical protein
MEHLPFPALNASALCGVIVFFVNFAASWVVERLLYNVPNTAANYQRATMGVTVAMLFSCLLGGLAVRFAPKVDKYQAAIAGAAGSVLGIVLELLIDRQGLWTGPAFAPDVITSAFIQFNYLLQTVGGPILAATVAVMVTSRHPVIEWPAYAHVSKPYLVLSGVIGSVTIPVLMDFANASPVYENFFLYAPVGLAAALILAYLPERTPGKVIALVAACAGASAAGYLLYVLLYGLPLTPAILASQAIFAGGVGLTIGLTEDKSAWLMIVLTAFTGMAFMIAVDAGLYSIRNDFVSIFYVATVGGRTGMSIALGLVALRFAPPFDYAVVRKAYARDRLRALNASAEKETPPAD